MEIKEKLREHKQGELESAIAASEKLMRRIRTMEEEIVNRYNGMVSRCMTGEQFSLLIGHLAYLDGKKAAMREEKEKTDERISAVRRELLGLTMEVKMFEKLKVKALQAAKIAAHRKEQKMMDDLALRVEGKLEKKQRENSSG
jgi:flagellar export protein FliJ